MKIPENAIRTCISSERSARRDAGHAKACQIMKSYAQVRFRRIGFSVAVYLVHYATIRLIQTFGRNIVTTRRRRWWKLMGVLTVTGVGKLNISGFTSSRAYRSSTSWYLHIMCSWCSTGNSCNLRALQPSTDLIILFRGEHVGVVPGCCTNDVSFFRTRLFHPPYGSFSFYFTIIIRFQVHAWIWK